ncbi:hypothetical protein J2X14_002409 [Pantoea alhagi]|nr:hypothetical protein [Pantoea alhagi]
MMEAEEEMEGPVVTAVMEAMAEAAVVVMAAMEVMGGPAVKEEEEARAAREDMMGVTGAMDN